MESSQGLPTQAGKVLWRQSGDDSVSNLRRVSLIVLIRAADGG